MRMRRITIIAAIAIIAGRAHAQSSRGAVTPPETYTPKAEHFRIQSGKLYNIELSSLWRTTGRNLEDREWQLGVIGTHQDGLLVRQWKRQILEYKRIPTRVDSSARIGRFIGGAGTVPPMPDYQEPIYGPGKEYGKTFWIQYATNGQTFDESRKLFELGTTNFGGSNVVAYSLGLPNTPENRAAYGIK